MRYSFILTFVSKYSSFFITIYIYYAHSLNTKLYLDRSESGRLRERRSGDLPQRCRGAPGPCQPGRYRSPSGRQGLRTRLPWLRRSWCPLYRQA